MSTSTSSRGCPRLNTALAAAIVLSMVSLANGGALCPVQGIGVAMLEAISASDALFECAVEGVERTAEPTTGSMWQPSAERSIAPTMRVERPTMPGRGNLPPPGC